MERLPTRVSHTAEADLNPESRPLRTPLGEPLGDERPCYPALDLGLTPYLPLQELQGRLRQAVAEGLLPGVVLLLEHEPVITLGSRGEATDVYDLELAHRRRIPLVHSERGGQVTLHAPGQLVSYLVVPVPQRDLTSYVRGLEEIILQILRRLGLAGHRRAGHPGVYVAGEKIASVGLRCQRWVASHGTSLNVSNDLSLFDLIVSCGEPGLRQTSIAALTKDKVDLSLVKRLYLAAAAEVFGWRIGPLTEVDYRDLERWLGLVSSDEEQSR